MKAFYGKHLRSQLGDNLSSSNSYNITQSSNNVPTMVQENLGHFLSKIGCICSGPQWSSSSSSGRKQIISDHGTIHISRSSILSCTRLPRKSRLQTHLPSSNWQYRSDQPRGSWQEYKFQILNRFVLFLFLLMTGNAHQPGLHVCRIKFRFVSVFHLKENESDLMDVIAFLNLQGGFILEETRVIYIHLVWT